MGPLSVARQDKGIRDKFPGFRLRLDGGFVAAWEGELTPNARTYRVSVFYFPRYNFAGGLIANPYVSVRVISPEITFDPCGTGEAPPHIYRDELGGFKLCLYDHRNHEWFPSQSIADTIIPWAAEWLFYFEAWLHSGMWSGGGVHPENRSSDCLTSSPFCHDPQVPFPTAEFHRIGRQIGTSVSFPLMAAASGGYSLPQYLRILRQASAEAPSPIISISPPALPRAV